MTDGATISSGCRRLHSRLSSMTCPCPRFTCRATGAMVQGHEYGGNCLGPTHRAGSHLRTAVVDYERAAPRIEQDDRVTADNHCTAVALGHWLAEIACTH
jgi:hypothetical protein